MTSSFNLFPGVDLFAGPIGLGEGFSSLKNHANNLALKISLGDKNLSVVNEVILDRLSGAKLWALVGGPPCQAYSLVCRSRMTNDPAFSDDIRYFLYKEYLSIIADQQPPIFVMENVKGLLSSKVGNKFAIDMILEDLKSSRFALKRVSPGLGYKLYGLGGSGHQGEQWIQGTLL